MIWPTGVGTFLISRGDSPSLADSQGHENTEDPVVGRSGYLGVGPARPLVWMEEPEIATSTVVLQFQEHRSEPITPASSAPPPATLAYSVDTGSPQWMVAEVETRSMGQPVVAAAPAPEPPPPAPPPPPTRRALDEQFVNWVTRRIDDTKVEIPFQLPTEPAEGEAVAPTERVRVRYRVEP